MVLRSPTGVKKSRYFWYAKHGRVTGGLAPPGSCRTGRKPLDSSGPLTRPAASRHASNARTARARVGRRPPETAMLGPHDPGTACTCAAPRASDIDYSQQFQSQQ